MFHILKQILTLEKHSNTFHSFVPSDSTADKQNYKHPSQVIPFLKFKIIIQTDHLVIKGEKFQIKRAEIQGNSFVFLQ